MQLPHMEVPLRALLLSLVRAGGVLPVCATLLFGQGWSSEALIEFDLLADGARGTVRRQEPDDSRLADDPLVDVIAESDDWLADTEAAPEVIAEDVTDSRATEPTDEQGETANTVDRPPTGVERGHCPLGLPVTDVVVGDAQPWPAFVMYDPPVDTEDWPPYAVGRGSPGMRAAGEARGD